MSYNIYNNDGLNAWRVPGSQKKNFSDILFFLIYNKNGIGKVLFCERKILSKISIKKLIIHHEKLY